MSCSHIVTETHANNNFSFQQIKKSNPKTLLNKIQNKYSGWIFPYLDSFFSIESAVVCNYRLEQENTLNPRYFVNRFLVFQPTFDQTNNWEGKSKLDNSDFVCYKPNKGHVWQVCPKCQQKNLISTEIEEVYQVLDTIYCIDSRHHLLQFTDDFKDLGKLSRLSRFGCTESKLLSFMTYYSMENSGLMSNRNELWFLTNFHQESIPSDKNKDIETEQSGVVISPYAKFFEDNKFDAEQSYTCAIYGCPGEVRVTLREYFENPVVLTNGNDKNVNNTFYYDQTFIDKMVTVKRDWNMYAWEGLEADKIKKGFIYTGNNFVSFDMYEDQQNFCLEEEYMCITEQYLFFDNIKDVQSSEGKVVLTKEFGEKIIFYPSGNVRDTPYWDEDFLSDDSLEDF